jgi:hypothetical protein
MILGSVLSYGWTAYCVAAEGVRLARGSTAGGEALLMGKYIVANGALLAGQAAAMGRTFLAQKLITPDGLTLLLQSLPSRRPIASFLFNHMINEGGSYLARKAITAAGALAIPTDANQAAAILIETARIGMNYVPKTFAAVEAANDIREVVNSEKLTQTEKVHRVATCTLFVILQMADIGVNITNCSSNTKVRSRIGVELSHLSREVSKKAIRDEISFDDLIDLLSIATLGGGDIATVLTTEFPNKYGHLKGYADLLQTLALLGMKRDSVISVLKAVVHWATDKRVESSQRKATGKEEYMQQLKEVIEASNIGDFTRIPPLFESNPNLMKWICPLTKKPIRYAVVIDVSATSENPIAYEKAAIEKWFADNYGKQPPGWPSKITAGVHRLVDSTSIQEFIDSSLKDLLEGMQEILQGQDLEQLAL